MFLSAAFVMLLATLAAFLIPSRKPTAEEKAVIGKWYRNIVSPETITPALLLCFVSMSSILYTSYMVPYASELGIAEGTVKRHVSNILGKSGLESRTQLALALGA